MDIQQGGGMLLAPPWQLVGRKVVLAQDFGEDEAAALAQQLEAAVGALVELAAHNGTLRSVEAVMRRLEDHCLQPGRTALRLAQETQMNCGQRRSHLQFGSATVTEHVFLRRQLYYTRLVGVKQSIVTDTFEKKSTVRVPSREDAAQIAGLVASGKSISVLVLATLSIPCGEQLVSRGRPRKIEP